VLGPNIRSAVETEATMSAEKLEISGELVKLAELTASQISKDTLSYR